LLYSLQAKAVPPMAVRPRVTNRTRLNIGAVFQLITLNIT
jgi:hypothetical protein